MDYHRLVYFDKLLPVGRLREPVSALERADLIIVTKCPRYITPMDRRGIVESLHTSTWQRVFFTTYSYPDHIADLGENPLLVTGIASPRQMIYDLRKIIPHFDSMSFPDHHAYTKTDIEAIRHCAEGRTILTTEKDATRLHGLENVKVIPIEVEFLDGKQQEFDNIITHYVEQHQRDALQKEQPHNAKHTEN